MSGNWEGKIGFHGISFFINLEMLRSRTYFLLNGMKMVSVIYDDVMLNKF